MDLAKVIKYIITYKILGMITVLIGTLPNPAMSLHAISDPAIMPDSHP